MWVKVANPAKNALVGPSGEFTALLRPPSWRGDGKMREREGERRLERDREE